MKKSLLVSSAAALLLSLSAVAPLAVSAAGDNDPATGTTNAEFTVDNTDDGDGKTPGGTEGTGDQKDLWLVTAPDVHFGTVQLSSLIKNDTTTTTMDSNTTSKTNDPIENQTGALQVTDLRGTSAGWNLSAKVSNAVNTSGASLSGELQLAFKKDADKTNNLTTNPAGDTGVAVAKLTTAGNFATIWSAKGADATTDPKFAGEGQGDNVAQIDGTQTKFVLNKNAAATTGTYKATITWSLMSTPDAQ